MIFQPYNFEKYKKNIYSLKKIIIKEWIFELAIYSQKKV